MSRPYDQKLFHVTPEFNLNSVLKSGIDPKRSRGKLEVSWWVNEARLTWAMAHVSARWSVPVNKLLICHASIPEVSLKRTAFEGVFMVASLVKITSVSGTGNYLE